LHVVILHQSGETRGPAGCRRGRERGAGV